MAGQMHTTWVLGSAHQTGRMYVICRTEGDIINTVTMTMGGWEGRLL